MDDFLNESSVLELNDNSDKYVNVKASNISKKVNELAKLISLIDVYKNELNEITKAATANPELMFEFINKTSLFQTKIIEIDEYINEISVLFERIKPIEESFKLLINQYYDKFNPNETVSDEDVEKYFKMNEDEINDALLSPEHIMENPDAFNRVEKVISKFKDDENK